MGIYGVDVYNQTHFGLDPTLVRPDFSVDPFQFMALDYSTLHLTWHPPHSIIPPGQTQPDCTFLRLVRNPRNLPQDEDDGSYVWGTGTTIFNPNGSIAVPPYSNPVQRYPSYTDTGLGGGFVYYTMWGWSNKDSIWIRCSDLIGLVPLNWGYGYRLYNLLPMAYRDADYILVDPYNPWPVDGPQPPLQRFLSLLGFQLDFIRTELESLMSVNDPLNCSGALLPVLAQELGLPNEPEMGMQQERTLVDNAIHLYKLKGSARGISEFASILTGYPMAALAHHGYNVLLCRDDSIGETSIGTWQYWPPAFSNFPDPTPAGGGANVLPKTSPYGLTQIPNLLSGSIAGMTDPMNVYPGMLEPTNPSYNDTGIQILASTAGDRYITTARIPITDFLSATYGPGYITWRIQIWSATSRTVKLSVWGSNGNGTPIQIIGEQSFTENPGHWTQMTITGNISQFIGGQPIYWVYPVIHIVAAGANEAHYVTMMGLWPCQSSDIGVNTPAYDYSRDVKVIVAPQTANLLSNTLTSFKYGFDGITAAADPTQPNSNLTCGLTIDYVSAEDPAAVNGVGTLQVNATGPGATVWFGLVSAWTQPLPTVPLGWFADPSHNWFPNQILTLVARTWFDPPGTPIGTEVNGWFVMDYQYFSVQTPVLGGIWFPAAAQPPQNGNLGPFLVPANQPFNFSVCAEYLNVIDPSNAVMEIGFRWYYPDGTYSPDTQNSTTYPLTNSFYDAQGNPIRYSYPPPGQQNEWMAFPPPEPLTNAQPIYMYPFIRFPAAQQSTFVLNSAMLSPGYTLPTYMDTSMFPGNPDYIMDSHGASYYYRRRTTRVQRLEMELYRWIPIGASHTETYGAEAVLVPLDPTAWLHPAVALHGTTTLVSTPS